MNLTTIVIITALFMLALLWLAGALVEKLVQYKSENKEKDCRKRQSESAYYEGYCDGFLTGRKV